MSDRLQNIVSPFRAEFSAIRVVVMNETSPMSDKYEQLLLNREQYIKLLDMLESFLPRTRTGDLAVTTINRPVKIMGVKSWYERRNENL